MKLITIILTIIISFTSVFAQNIHHKDLITNNKLWKPQEGKWRFKNNTLKQISEDNYFPAIFLMNKKYNNINLSVDFKPISGFIDASGGIIFAAVNKNNYFIVRANGLENNFTLYKFKNGVRRQLATAIVKKPSLNKYHTIAIKVTNNKIYAYLNHKLYITYNLNKPISGYVGLWTKADSITEFKNFIIK